MFSLQRELEFSGFGGRSWEQKSFKNQSKNDAKKVWYLGIDVLLNFLPFSSQVGLLGASWGPLGSLLAASWASWERLGSVLGASWGRLGASWAILGHLGASWSVLGRLGLKKPPNINLSK